jgi:broad specificity phosphatase PhoE
MTGPAAALAFLAALPERAQEVVFLVRHAEKADESKDTALSAAGLARARALADKLRDAGVTAIYTSEFKRTRQTAQPLAEALKLTPRAHPAADRAGLVALLHREHPNDRLLVVGHSNTVAGIIAAFGVPEKIAIAEDEFDDLFVLVPQASGPPMLLHLHQ